MKQCARINLKATYKFKHQLMNEAIHLGFTDSKGKLNFSRFLRWILRKGNRPIDRSQYEELIRFNQNLIKLGGLSNQYLYHLNRERKILLEKRIEENNKKYLENMDSHNEHLKEIKSLLSELKQVSEKIYFLENA